MNAPPNEIITPDGSPFDWAAFHGYEPQPGRTRHDGWTPEKQQTFLTALSEGHSVTSACNIVRMSKQSAYAFRHSARGAGFALGWEAALLRGRDVLADTLMDRALHGMKEWVDVDGKLTTRHRHDNRLAMAMLTRLDRRCEAPRPHAGQSSAAGSDAAQAAARLVAQDFEQYLALLGRGGGPARAGLFLGARAEAASEDDLAPIRALARADRWLRTHTDLAEPLDTGDLDPACRAEWSGEQWARAEAAGLVQLAPAPQPVADQGLARDGNGQDSQLCPPEDEDEPVWWDDLRGEWRTRFPPSQDFIGDQAGEFGEDGYSRTLDVEEQLILEEPYRIEVERRLAREARERDAWFAAQRGLLAAGAEGTDADRGDETPAAPGDSAREALSPNTDDADEGRGEEDRGDGAPDEPETSFPPAAGPAEDFPDTAEPGAGEAPDIAEAPDEASAQPLRSRPYTSSRKATPPSVAAAVM